MSLEERFDEIHQAFIEDKFIATDLIKEQCVQICDEETAKFAEWIRINAYDTGVRWYYQKNNEEYTTTELLEIYKQGL